MANTTHTIPDSLLTRTFETFALPIADDGSTVIMTIVGPPYPFKGTSGVVSAPVSGQLWPR